MTGFGLGWVNAATDYSRCLPRTCSGAAVVGWACSARRRWRCWVFGLLLAGSSPELGGALAADPVGAPATILPTWYLVPFVVVAVLGLIGGAVLPPRSAGAWSPAPRPAGLPARPAGSRRPGAWAGANLGVLVALLIVFLAILVFGRACVRRQEAADPPPMAHCGAI
ncbi:cytosine permease [Saccharopolyspora erythraea]|nr:cytosine permease [Saccharopolyspora erythraea]